MTQELIFRKMSLGEIKEALDAGHEVIAKPVFVDDYSDKPIHGGKFVDGKYTETFEPSIVRGYMTRHFAVKEKS